MTDQYKSRLFVYIKQNEDIKNIKSINEDNVEITYKDGSAKQISFVELLEFNK